ncbi:MAG: hypothetical protein M0042_15975 [Nitrospiraceae bacterium]|nr:hypothetical protein [Nitrospiraceae bacterium]
MAASAKEQKILIIDEYGFSRICSAILGSIGYKTEILSHDTDLPIQLRKDSIGLIVSSYPYGARYFEHLWSKNIPIIILSDGIDDQLIGILNKFEHSACMIKPLDYDKFKNTVKQAVEGCLPAAGGFSIE